MITEHWNSPQGIEYTFEYHECDDFSILPQDRCKQIYGVCFVEPNNIVIGFGGNKHSWGLIGGSIEVGETYEQTFVREIQEESNMKVLDFKPIGYQKVLVEGKEPIYQLRVVARVEPLGQFIEDPAGGITEIKIIEIDESKTYFDWGAISDTMLSKAKEVSKIFFV
ncbi:NUDIX domain-containing protein [Candidatus Nomurabacteria bacterium]|nr:NUDIX domain-containing protein [Candidatus Nomurabacteria bacterium]